MFCRNCGNTITEGKVCTACGTEITFEPSQASTNSEYTFSSQPENVVYPNTNSNFDPGKSLGTAALVLGIVSITLGTLCSCIFSCLGGVLPFIAAIVGLILGIVAMNKSKSAGFKNKNALIGLILSAVALVIVIIFCSLAIVFFSALYSPEIFEYYY